jgi:hypothetical protein
MNAKWQKALQKQALQKIEAAAARLQGGDVVDLAQAKSDVRQGLFQLAIDDVWEFFGAGLMSAEIAEQILQDLEHKQLEERLKELLRQSDAHFANLNRTRLAAHRAARGVRKVRGAK